MEKTHYATISDVCSLSGHLKITDNKSMCPNMALVIDSWLQ